MKRKSMRNDFHKKTEHSISLEYKPYDTIVLKRGNIHASLNEIISS